VLNPLADQGVTPHDFIGGGLVSFSCPSMRGYRLRLYTFSQEYGFLSPMVFDAKRGSARSKFEPLSLVSVLPVKWRRLIDGYDWITCSHGIAHRARIDLMFVRPSTTGNGSSAASAKWSMGRPGSRLRSGLRRRRRW
jgi:hypothetical protein